jgi:hypothetical protein
MLSDRVNRVTFSDCYTSEAAVTSCLQRASRFLLPTLLLAPHSQTAVFWRHPGDTLAIPWRGSEEVT